MSNAIIAGYARTPFHFARKGKLASVRPDDLAAIPLRELMAWLAALGSSAFVRRIEWRGRHYVLKRGWPV